MNSQFHSGKTNSSWLPKQMIVSAFSAIIAVVIYAYFFDGTNSYIGNKTQDTAVQPSYVYLPAGEFNQNSFILAADKTIHGVVHVKVKGEREDYYYNPLYEFFYGQPMKRNVPVMGFGSGVIISNDGYIVTNNHVIEQSKEIEVVLNDRRTFQAKLIGTDPGTDIAVLKIEGKNLPYITSGNSDSLRVGEWVLAVGNPFNLTSTVTAGIVSAKGRSLDILSDKYKIESFIQTDAALNQGNSGGALVNLKGELVGINTAILSPSGAYSGNSFAVPVSIVNKVVADIIEYGEVQRAILGISIKEIDSELAKKLEMDEIKGVYIEGVREDGAAAEAGVKVGDIIIAINGVPVNSSAEIQEQVSRYRPNQKVELSLLRNKKEVKIAVTLTNIYGSKEIVKSAETASILGADIKTLSVDEAKTLRINCGVKILKLNDGKLKAAGVREGFIIRKVNDKPVCNVNELKTIFNSITGGVYLEGIYPNGIVAYYAFGL